MMKKYLTSGVAAIALCVALTSCSHDDFEPMTQAQIDKAKYDQVFLSYVGGSIAPNQTWGFGDIAGARMTRSQAAPVVGDITAPYDEAWVAAYLQTATEPNAENIADNYDDSHDQAEEGYWQEATAAKFEWTDVTSNLRYNLEWGPDSQEDKNFWIANCKPYNDGDYTHYDVTTQEEAMLKLKTILDNNGRSSWYTYTPATERQWIVTKEGGHVADLTFVLNYKITGTWSGIIDVAASEGYYATYDEATNTTTYGEKQDPFCARTIVVTGTWNITENQRIGSGGNIIIANGGTVNVAEGKQLQMVNHARLVVLPGGTLTGAGSVEVSNGNGAGEENYNGGIISTGTFNNNFGKFYNYGKFLVNEYQGGAQESNFYNHALASIDHFAGTGSTANARIFNTCQFYVKNNARIRNYEGVNGSALVVDGELMFSSSEDGTSDPTYVGLAQGALVKCATLYNNGTSWTGPTTGYAALEITDKITYLNWEQDHPENGGYFENNIYVKAGTWTNVPDGNGYHQTDPSDEANYALSIADYKFFTTVANCRGNNGVTKVQDGNTEIFPADEDYAKGVKGCSPGFKCDIPEEEDDDDEIVYDLRIIAEDLSASEDGDFDFNDVVLDVKYDAENAIICLQAAGGTLPLRIDGKDNWEVHKLFVVDTDYMVNTGAGDKRLKGNRKDNPIKGIVLQLGRGINNAAEANGIKLEVYKNNVWQELEAPKGEPSSKLAVGIDYNWLDERTSIKDSYPYFVDWANAAEFESIWWKTPAQ